MPTLVPQPDWLLQAKRLPVPVPHGCHADPEAVFADVVFDFTSLELQLRHFATQGCHDSEPHVPEWLTPWGGEEGPKWFPQQISTQHPLEEWGKQCGIAPHKSNDIYIWGNQGLGGTHLILILHLQLKETFTPT